MQSKGFKDETICLSLSRKSERVSAPPAAHTKRAKTPDKELKETKEQSPGDEFTGIYNNAR